MLKEDVFYELLDAYESAQREVISRYDGYTDQAEKELEEFISRWIDDYEGAV